MTLSSVALIKLPLRVFDALPRADNQPDDGTFRVKGPDGKTLGLRYLQDAALVTTPHRFGDDDEALTDLLWDVFGDDLADHDDDRGIFVLPSVATPHGDTYERVLDEMGTLGVWVSLGDEAPQDTHDNDTPQDPNTDDAPGKMPSPDFMAAVASLGQALGPGTFAGLQHAMLSGDMEAFTRMQHHIAQQVAQRPELAAQIQNLMGMLPPDILQAVMQAPPETMMRQVQQALGKPPSGER
jgi:hypothetical protein